MPPHIKRCCPVVWDKYGKIEPMTNEKWFCQLPTEEKAKFFHGIVIRAMQATWDGKKPDYPAYLSDWKKWLKEKHEEMKWISVKEKLPKEAGWVKAKDKNGNVVRRYYNPVQTTRFPKGFSYIINGVLSWRDDNIVEWLKQPHK